MHRREPGPKMTVEVEQTGGMYVPSTEYNIGV